MRIVIALLCFLILTTSPVLAVEHLTSENFKETVSKVKPKKDYYIGGESIEVDYTIEPASSEDQKKLDERYYTIHSELKDAEVEAKVTLVVGATINHPTPDDETGPGYLQMKIGDTVEGIYQIKVKVKGVVPSIDERYREIKALYFEITDADEDVLQPIALKVYNLDKFNEDINKLKEKISELSARIVELKNEGYDVSNILSKFNKLKANLTIAEEYFSSKDYGRCDSKLDDVENQIEFVNESINELKANIVYDSVKKIMDNTLNKLEDIDVYLSQIINKVSAETYANLKVEYRDLKEEYNDLSTKIDDIKENYLDKGKYLVAHAKFKEIEKDVTKLNNRTTMLFEDVKKILEKKEEKKEFDIVALLKSNWVYFLGAVVALLVTIAVIYGFRRRGRKWDELR